MLQQRARGTREQLHHRLVRLDLGEDIADGDGVTRLLLPLDETTLLHGGRERLHHYGRCHSASLTTDD